MLLERIGIQVLNVLQESIWQLPLFSGLQWDLAFLSSFFFAFKFKAKLSHGLWFMEAKNINQNKELGTYHFSLAIHVRSS